MSLAWCRAITVHCLESGSAIMFYSAMGSAIADLGWLCCSVGGLWLEMAWNFISGPSRFIISVMILACGQFIKNAVSSFTISIHCSGYLIATFAHSFVNCSNFLNTFSSIDTFLCSAISFWLISKCFQWAYFKYASTSLRCYYEVGLKSFDEEMWGKGC